MTTTTVLSYGMGADSTAILLEWLSNPASRTFELADLVVVTAQTGNEFDDTRALVEGYVLPAMASAGVRFVEIARSQPGSAKPYTVLQDTRSPERLHIDGDYALSTELERAGTIPTSGGVHLCSLKSKAAPIEAWLGDNLDAGYRHVMGFNAAEGKRIERDVAARDAKGALPLNYTIAFGFNSAELKRVEKAQLIRAEKGQATPFFPLVEWGWDWDRCVVEIRRMTGAEWKKSCCSFCPFAGGRKPILERYASDPEAAAEALMLEHLALALNPRMALYKTKTLESIVEADDNYRALRLFRDRLETEPYAVYRVRRIFTSKGKADRSVERQETGTRKEMLTLLHGLGAVSHQGGVPRIVVEEKDPENEVFPQIEEHYVAAPARVANKTGRGDQVRSLARFDGRWNTIVKEGF